MIRHRIFSDYETYKNKQAAKASYNNAALLATTKERTAGFKKLFKKNTDNLMPGNIICLGARTGCEVIGAREAGFKNSIGVDLCPIGDTVIEADWDTLPFDDSSFSNAFTNSIDHVADLNKLIKEIKRVLKPEGVFFMMIVTRSGKKGGPNTFENWLEMGGNEAMYWDDPFDVAEAFMKQGFILENQISPKGKWNSFFLRNKK